MEVVQYSDGYVDDEGNFTRGQAPYRMQRYVVAYHSEPYHQYQAPEPRTSRELAAFNNLIGNPKVAAVFVSKFIQGVDALFDFASDTKKFASAALYNHYNTAFTIAAGYPERRMTAADFHQAWSSRKYTWADLLQGMLTLGHSVKDSYLVQAFRKLNHPDAKEAREMLSKLLDDELRKDANAVMHKIIGIMFNSPEFKGNFDGWWQAYYD